MNEGADLGDVIVCVADRRLGAPDNDVNIPHPIVDPAEDQELQRVLRWFTTTKNARELLTEAVVDSIDYVLDGAYTGNLDITQLLPQEKTLIGVKLESRVLEALKLPKTPPLDTEIDHVPVDIKNSVGTSWMIPIEGQCRLCLLIGIDQANDRFSAHIFRAHRKFLGGDDTVGNGDRKRGINKRSRERYAVPVFDPVWTAIPRNPLRDLTPEQHELVFQPGNGLKNRSVLLFRFLPGVVIPRRAFLTVGTRLLDPMRRIRQAREELLKEHGLLVLNASKLDQRKQAAELGHDLGTGDWVAVPLADLPIPTAEAPAPAPQPWPGNPGPATPGHPLP